VKTEKEIKDEIDNLTQILKDSYEYNRKFEMKEVFRERNENIAHKITALKWVIE
jgi:cell fate (sporulation/competence/biofilm development) regulator YlbF (YheA/YmcA/DUF963 family)